MESTKTTDSLGPTLTSHFMMGARTGECYEDVYGAFSATGKAMESCSAS